MIILKCITDTPVSIAERSEACTVYDRLNIEIAGSNQITDTGRKDVN
jgi:hypothetical protein